MSDAPKKMTLKRWLKSKLYAWQRRKRLLDQLVSAVTAVAVVSGFTAGALLISVEYFSARDRQIADLGVQARILASNASAALAFGDAAAAGDILHALRQSPDVIGARLVGGDGVELAAYLADGRSEDAMRAAPVTIHEAVVEDGMAYGTLTIHAGRDSIHRQLLRFAALVMGAVLVAVLMLRLLFQTALQRMAKPINFIIATMQKITREGDYSLRTNIRAANETGEVSEAFDAMLDQIQRRDEQLAHELIERRKTEARLEHLTRHDSLTGLPNRLGLNEALALRPAGERRSLALLLLDMDHFKAINDSLGHDAGDALLRNTAQTLAALMTPDVRLFRMGGDEFAVLLEGGSPGSAEALASRLLGAMAQAQTVQAQEVFVTGSAGIALYPQHGGDLNDLLRKADTALYAAKSAGRNRAQFYDAVMAETGTQRRALETDLRHAIERGQLFLVYQPQLDLKTGRIAGAEALARWKHPERGMVSPGEFIPLAEECGLIGALGEWVLRTACGEGAALLRQGSTMPFRLSVNLSPVQLADPRLAERVGAILRDTGFPPDRLELEITESAAIEDLDGAAERMRAVTRLGVSFAMDDFGVGATSLSYLKRLPLSMVKIDRSFVRDLPGDPDDAAIATAIIRMAHELSMPVLAEGVETPEQKAFLRDRGCDLVQGYLISRGVSPLEAALKTIVK